jgi:predicted ATPase/class 3 adenylate cyclase
VRTAIAPGVSPNSRQRWATRCGPHPSRSGGSHTRRNPRYNQLEAGYFEIRWGYRALVATLPTGTVTLLFSDIEGSTRLWEQHPAAMNVALQRHDELLRSAIESAGGYIFKTVGDAFCAAFASARNGVEAVESAQRALHSEPWPEHAVLRVRIALHTGETEERGGDYFGPAVNRIARLEAIAHGGQVVVSEATAALIRDRLPAHIELVDLGSHRLKDLGRPEQVFGLLIDGLPSHFPPLRSLDNPALANNLPAQSSNFIGRGREVAEVRELVEKGRLVTLTGPGGCGKTRLSLQVAVELLDGSGDGVWLVELAAVSDEEAVASTMGEALGVTNQNGRPVLDALLDALELQSVVIVLDNCEHLIGGCAKVADAIVRRCPQVHLITTSREPLGIGGETLYRVPSLSLPDQDQADIGAPGESDAVALFIDRATAQGVDLGWDKETGPLVESICRRLDGMPLAIELAAARLRSLPLAVLNDRLDQRFRLLTGGSRSALPRQQTLRATVDWSYSLLNGDEQTVLRRLSVFADGFDLEAAEAVCGLTDIEPFAVTNILGSLVDKSLAVAEPIGGHLRYRLLETIRQFSAERLVEVDEQDAAAVGAAHSAYFLSVAELAAPYLTGPGQGRWLERLDADHANLRRAIEHAASVPGGTSLVLRFAVALQRFWRVLSRFDAIELLMPVLKRSEARDDSALLVQALTTVATVARYIGMSTARELSGEAVEIARQLGDDRLLSQSLAVQCAACYFAGDNERGIALGKESVERARRLGDDVLVGESLAMYLLSTHVMEPSHTQELFSEAIACTARSGDQYIHAILQNNAGCYELEAGNIREARLHLELSAEAGRALGSRQDYIMTGNLAWVLREEGVADRAGSTFEEALRLSRRVGDRSGIAYANLGLACLASDRGNWHRSAVLHGAAQAFLDMAGEAWQSPESRYRAGSIDAVRSHFSDHAFESAYAEGKGLSLRDAVNLALG